MLYVHKAVVFLSLRPLLSNNLQTALLG